MAWLKGSKLINGLWKNNGFRQLVTQKQWVNLSCGCEKKKSWICQLAEGNNHKFCQSIVKKNWEFHQGNVITKPWKSVISHEITISYLYKDKKILNRKKIFLATKVAYAARSNVRSLTIIQHSKSYLSEIVKFIKIWT